MWKFSSFLLVLVGGVVVVLGQQSSKSVVGGTTSSNTASTSPDFSCPEDFGYFPHPTDCTQYYVCVFGGALLESCTGGLMYSHELQTCDWPRNTQCGGSAGVVTTSSTTQRPPKQHQQNYNYKPINIESYSDLSSVIATSNFQQEEEEGARSGRSYIQVGPEKVYEKKTIQGGRSAKPSPPAIYDYANQRYAASVAPAVLPSPSIPASTPYLNLTTPTANDNDEDDSYYVYEDEDDSYYSSTTTTTVRPHKKTRPPTIAAVTTTTYRPKTRPTLRSKQSIVNKAAASSVVGDVYINPPRRPDPVYPTPASNTPATKCKPKSQCQLPDCYCGGKNIPLDIDPSDTPQIVLLTFDDSVNDLNKNLYKDLFQKGRKNPNGCPISATFYVSHEWTDYSQVQNLAAEGHEIASHSVSHSFGESFSQSKWLKEINGQREILAAYGGVKLSEVRGMRAPFLAIGGNNMFKMLHEANFTYDSSMPIYENRPPSWPYTLDYKIFHDCMIPPCPTKSYPGVWEVPMVMWQDLKGGRCSMGDACSNPPTAEGVYQMLAKNFERHYTTNRAPFGLYYHAAWFTQPHHKEGFEAFLDTITNMPDVWLVTNWQAIQWIRNPTPSSRIGNFAPWNECRTQEHRPALCSHPRVCNLWHKSGVRYMKTCQSCPEQYPWTGNTGVPFTL